VTCVPVDAACLVADLQSSSDHGQNVTVITVMDGPCGNWKQAVTGGEVQYSTG
jgi:hypothetical protein